VTRSLPVGWILARPTDLAADEQYSLGIGPFGSNLKVSDYTDGGVPLVFVRNIRAESFEGEGVKFVSERKADELRAHWVQPGDVLITKMGDPPGDSALYPESMPVGVITADCVKWRIDPAVGISRYFVYATRTTDVQQQIRDITKGVAQRKVSLARFKTVQYPVAPLPTQKLIVEALDSHLSRLHDVVTTLQRVQRNLKRYRASVLKAAVEGRLVPTEAELAREEGRDYEPADVLLTRILKERRVRWIEEEAEKGRAKAQAKAIKARKPWTKADDEAALAKARAAAVKKYKEPAPSDTNELPDLPEGWCWASTEELFVFVTSGSRGWAKYYAEEGELFLRMGNLDHDTIGLDLTNVQRVQPPPGAEGTRTQVEAFDLLISITADVGMIGLVPDGLGTAYINQHVALARPASSEVAVFLAWYLASQPARNQMLRLQRGATKVGLGLDDIRNIAVPLPPRNEQALIVLEIERALSIGDESLVIVEHNLKRTARFRQSILKWAFEGKLVDQDPSDEPASVLLERIKAEREKAHAAAKASKKPARTKRKKKSA